VKRQGADRIEFDRVYDPIFKLNDDGARYMTVSVEHVTILPKPGLPFSLVFRAEPGREDVVLKIASAYEAASRRGEVAVEHDPVKPAARAEIGQQPVGGLAGRPRGGHACNFDRRLHRRVRAV
jgi:hypothetical protein